MGDFDQGEWKPHVSFSGLEFHENPEHSFVHGVEVGMIVELMSSGTESEIVRTVHSENKDVLRRFAVVEGWDMKFEPTDTEGWALMTLEKKRSARGDNPRGLRIV